MARYKAVNYEQDKFIPIRFSQQILPGTFEYTLNYLVDNVIDVAVFIDGCKLPANAVDPQTQDLARLIYNCRLGMVEPVFGNHRNHGRDRFTLRGKVKVNIQWLVYSIVHNVGKIHGYGEGFT